LFAKINQKRVHIKTKESKKAIGKAVILKLEKAIIVWGGNTKIR